MHPFSDHIWNMKSALEEAEKAFRLDEVPVGAVLIDSQGSIISKAHNLKEKTHNPLGHAEILAISTGAKARENWRLTDCWLYVTLEPCVMCMGALVQSRIAGVVFGAYDIKGGAISTGHMIHNHPVLNHRFPVIGGIEHYSCSRILSQFFKERRSRYKNQKPQNS